MPLLSKKLAGKKVYVSEEVRCTSSKASMDDYRKFILSHGATATKDMKKADIVLVDTCGVTDSNEQDSLERISRSQSAAKEDAKVIVCGCLAGIAPKKIQERFQGEFFSPRNEQELPRILGIDEEELRFATDIDAHGRFVEGGEHEQPMRLQRLDPRFPPEWAAKLGKTTERKTRKKMYAINVSQGCLGNCSFCVIPFGRGRTRSLPIDLIVSKIRSKMKAGVRDFILGSEDTGAYGYDIQCTIVDLLEKIHEIRGPFKLYIHNFDPRWLRKYDAALRPILAQGKIAQILLPIQSGSDTVLGRMKRVYQMGHVLPILREYRKLYPQIFMTTQIIAGFPGETDEEFKETLAVAKEGIFDYVQVFEFSRRKGAETERMDNHLPPEVIKQRTEILRAEWKRLSWVQNGIN